MAEYDEPEHPLKSKVESLWVSLSRLGAFIGDTPELLNAQRPMVYVNGEPCAIVRLINRENGGYDLELDSRSYCIEKMGIK